MSDSGAIRVLLADDEPHLGAILEQFLTAKGHRVTAVRDGIAALAALREQPFDVALLDVVMPGLDGLEVLRQIREEATPPEILIITGNGTIETTLAALRLGAYDVLSKPYRMAEIDLLIRRAWEKRILARGNHQLRARLATPNPTHMTSAVPASFITQYAPLQAMLTTLDHLRANRSPVIVWGEPGTGKRALALWMHGDRAPIDEPFIEWSAAAEVDPLAALFGAEPRDGQPVRIGVLEMAGRGTAFLRAIARLDHGVQRALADAVRTGAFVRVGGTQPMALEARVVVALQRDPAILVAEGSLDAAAVDTLSSVRIALPTLSERAVDIPLLAQRALDVVGAGQTLSPEAVDWLERRPWPHNVRELMSVVERAARGLAARHDASVLTAADLGASPPVAMPATIDAVLNGRSLLEVERAFIAETLQAVGWHQGHAAQRLGISPKTLYRKIREYGFSRPTGRNAR